VERKDYAAFIEYLDKQQNSVAPNLDASSWKQNILPVMQALASRPCFVWTVCCGGNQPAYLNKMESHLKSL
jgi:hypothetical protein